VAGGGRAGDKALEGLFRKYRRPLLAFLIRRGMDARGAEDQLQEVFLQVVRGAGALRNDAKVSTWLYRIARNLHIEAVRRVRPEDTMHDEAWFRIGQAAAGDGAVSMEARAAEDLHECFDRAYGVFAATHPGAAEALDKVVRLGWSARDLAAFLERTEGATREFLSQCRITLRRYLEPCREHPGQG
jgi:RNA polymerase sigma factor (sigma-70 family)